MINPQFALAALLVVGIYYGGKSIVHGVKRAEHKIVSVFHHKPAPKP